MIPTNKVEWSILPSVQNFLTGTTNECDSIETVIDDMSDSILSLCAIQSDFGFDVETILKVNNVICSCSDVLELLKRFKQDMEESVEN